MADAVPIIRSAGGGAAVVGAAIVGAAVGSAALASGTFGGAALGVTRSLSGRRWIWRNAEERISLGIAQRLGVPDIVGRMLAARGVGIEGAADFLDPTLRALLPDPSLLVDMEAAA